MTFFSLGILVINPDDVQRYLDPGSGSLIIQLILAGLLAAGVFFRAFWSRFKGKGRQDNPNDDSFSDDQ